jgi:hypothetical protein
MRSTPAGRVIAHARPHAPPIRRSPSGIWLIYYGDIPGRVGNPHDSAQWEWRCGFYPGSNPGEHQSGTAASFAEARADFESAWKIFLSKRTEADFQEWRDQRDWTAEKYRRFDRGERMPPDWRASAPAACFEIGGPARHANKKTRR